MEPAKYVMTILIPTQTKRSVSLMPVRPPQKFLKLPVTAKYVKTTLIQMLST
jgi:hypothetical protein